MLGEKVKDQISGFTGIVTGKAEYITGCVQYLIQPQSEENDYKEAQWIDEHRLIIIKGQGIKLVKQETKQEIPVEKEHPVIEEETTIFTHRTGHSKPAPKYK